MFVAYHRQWFRGGKTNICYNAVDRNVESGNGDKIAMYWEGNEPSQDGKLSYSVLLDKVCQVNLHSLLYQHKCMRCDRDVYRGQRSLICCVVLCVAGELPEKRWCWKG